MTTAFGPSLRHRWWLEPGLAFLNHGSFGACPREVLDAQTALRERMERQPLVFMDKELGPELDVAADRLGRFVGAPPGSVVFVENATGAVNAVVRSLRFEAGDVIVTTSHVYNAVRNALRFVCERTGAVLRVAEIPYALDGPDEAFAAFVAQLDGPVKLAVVDHLTSATALVYPIERMVRACRERGIPVLVDGAHGPGQVPIDLAALDPDWYTGNAHKWMFAPKGCAFLYSREDRRDIHPLVISHGYQEGYREAFHWVGTRDPSAWLAIGAALDFIEGLGGARAVREHNRRLAWQAGELLAQAWAVPQLAPASMRAALVALPFPGDAPPEDAPRLHDALLAQGVEVPVFPFGGRCLIRISAQVYNGIADYERLAEAVLRLRTA